jgi:hypothetical protein
MMRSSICLFILIGLSFARQASAGGAICIPPGECPIPLSVPIVVPHFCGSTDLACEHDSDCASNSSRRASCNPALVKGLKLKGNLTLLGEVSGDPSGANLVSVVLELRHGDRLYVIAENLRATSLAGYLSPAFHVGSLDLPNDNVGLPGWRTILFCGQLKTIGDDLLAAARVLLPERDFAGLHPMFSMVSRAKRDFPYELARDNWGRYRIQIGFAPLNAENIGACSMG